jgi:flagellar basal-body rod modification protein FlgD
MAIQATQSTGNPAATASTSLSGNKQVTQDDFLKLLISQLQNQDPLKPLDNQEFAQQLATFNSLEQLISVNQKLGTLADTMSKSNQFSASNLLGKQVITSGNQISVGNGQEPRSPIRSMLMLPKWPWILNSTGDVVRHLQLTNQSAGDQTVPWDGKNSVGAAVPAGAYTFDVSATDSKGSLWRPQGVSKALLPASILAAPNRP